MKKMYNLLKKKIQYELDKRQILLGIGEGICCLVITALLFFDNLFMVILMLPYLHIYLKKKEKHLKEKNELEVSAQFRDGMLSINAALGVGYSVENAFSEAVRELENLYKPDSIIVKEFREVVRRIDLNENVEDALEAMAERLKIEECVYFAEVFRYAKRSGGNLIDIIKKTSENISEKMGVKEEISVLISGKKMEQKIMNMMPFGIIAYLRFGSYEFIAPMYGNVFGFCVMTICLLMYLAAKILSEKITEIAI